MASNNIHCISFDAQGHVWFATHKGISELNGSTWSTFTRKDGLICDSAETILADDNGNIWIGTMEGLSKYNGTTFTNYTIDNGLAGNFVRTIAKDAHGVLWFGTNNGLSMFDGMNWTNDTLNKNINLIAIDIQGVKWLGTANGIMKYDGINWVLVKQSSIIAISIDSHNNKWFVEEGISIIWKFDGTNWTKITAEEVDGELITYVNGSETSHGLTSNYVMTLTIDAQDNKWFGTDGGISELKAN